ncbi:MAG TPA: ring-cleaving dioxygenase [Chitinophagaceae bacterium]|nr:ring-cleaving dioxygenase [Chitinophagaceae bacterium]
MNNQILGLHHITAIANNAQANFAFYTKVLGLRMVKKTVNFDDPGTYHFYYGNETGEPGTILTFFPWEGIGPGRNGTGMATDIRYAVPQGSLPFWAARFKEQNVLQQPIAEVFGSPSLSFQDPDGLQLTLVEASNDKRTPWITDAVGIETATRGFHSVELSLKDSKATASVLTDLLGYQLIQSEGKRHRFATSSVDTASIIDILEIPEGRAGVSAAGTNHHIAFRVKDEEVQMAIREKILSKGLNITPKINRDYFYSLYFREPGGVLFEIATDNPGFAVDEPVDQLGSSLRLPKQYEPARAKIEAELPKLN